jgi:hypothetical protein
MTQSDPNNKSPYEGKGPKQTRKDRAIVARLEYPSVEKAAAAIGVHPSTFFRWLKEPGFRHKLNEALNAESSQAFARLQQASPVAANRLVTLATDKNTPASVVVAACNSILNHGARSYQWNLFEERLAKLEALAELREKDNGPQNRAMLEEVIANAKRKV